MITSKIVQIKFIIILSSFIIIAAFATRFFNPAEKTSPVQMKINYVYFSNDQKSNNSGDCGLTYPVKRMNTESTPESLLTELFSGPTESEKSQGYSSFFSEKTKSILKSVKIQNNIAYVNLTDIRKIIPNASASCGSQQLIQQIKSTLMRVDSNVTDVRFAIDGNPETFYDWIQIGCDKNLNNCDPKPFLE